MAKNSNKKIVSYIISILLTIISAIIMAIGVKIFVSPNRFLSTGVTGISLIIGRIIDNIFDKHLETIITGICLFLFNIPLLILAWKKLSHRFTILTAINVIVNSICLTLLPDNLAEKLNLSVEFGNISFLSAALFVGMMNGAANALAYIVGGSTGGVDILSMFYSIRKQFSIGRITTAINGIIILIGLFIDGQELAIAKAFYTMIYLVISSIVIDIFFIRNKRVVLLITTQKGNEIAHEITNQFIRGVTILDARGGYTGEHKDFLYCACSSFEVIEIIKKVKEIDEHAFVSAIEANKVHGNFLNKELR